MYQLTIEAADTVTVTAHPDREAAHGHLVRHVVSGDYYLLTVQAGPKHRTYDLLALGDDRRRPRRVGHAIIEELPAESSDRTATHAAPWIERHRPAGELGPVTDPGVGHPQAAPIPRYARLSRGASIR